MRKQVSIFWKEAPFLKLLLATICGITIQWYLHLSSRTWLVIFSTAFFILLIFSFFPLFSRFRYGIVSGITSAMIFMAFGAWLVDRHSIERDPRWLGHYEGCEGFIATINEPLSEKAKTFKAIASVKYAIAGTNKIPCNGKIILYLQKEKKGLPGFGSKIFFRKKISKIENFAAGFDYKQYCYFQGITHQAFLKTKDYIQLTNARKNTAWNFIYQSRENILRILKENIPGEKETGLAEALLIGYRDDLDKTLVQSYTNTGVVHIIAISGLHLGLVYLLLAALTKPLLKKRIAWLRPLIIISSLWLFSVMAGAQPSILRSALMFTCIVAGETFSRKTSIYNTMAFSAFIILCLNPFSLWDVGFQLSYAAVASIIIFMRPVYNLFYIKNKVVDVAWKLNAVTLSAQILTIPLCIYHFHQFPNYFLLTNFIAVPLSSIILFGEIFLCVVSFVPFLVTITGKIIAILIWLMNDYIEKVESIPYSVSYGLRMNFIQVLHTYAFIITVSIWLMEKKPAVVKYALLAVFSYILSVI